MKYEEMRTILETLNFMKKKQLTYVNIRKRFLSNNITLTFVKLTLVVPKNNPMTFVKLTLVVPKHNPNDLREAYAGGT